jgi:hypothetical protein
MIDIHQICSKWALRLRRVGLRFDVAKNVADYGVPFDDWTEEYDADMAAMRLEAAADPAVNLEECAAMARADYGVD